MKKSNLHPIRIIGDSLNDDTKNKIREYSPYDFIFYDSKHIKENINSDWKLINEVADKSCLIMIHDINTQPYTHNFWINLEDSTKKIYPGVLNIHNKDDMGSVWIRKSI